MNTRRPNNAAEEVRDGRAARPSPLICVFDAKHGTFWGGSSNHGEDYGIAW